MARCERCGNEYDKTFTLSTSDGVSHTFDSFECAIAVAAPRCSHCGTRIIGHGVEAGDDIFCCAHCASAMGRHDLRDRAEAGSAGPASAGSDPSGIAPTRPPQDE